MPPGKLSALITCLGLPLVAAHLTAQEARKVDRHIASRVLGQERTITIGLPANYGIARRRYPAVYLLDGEQRVLLDLTIAVTAFDWRLDAIDHAMPPHIVVGIEQTDRGVEFGRSRAAAEAAPLLRRSRSARPSPTAPTFGASLPA